MKKFRKHSNRDAYQKLEPRKMLAGDVTATVNDGLLQIIGDAEGNEIIVAGRPDGTATVFPLGETTINGSADPFDVSTPLDDVDVRLNLGDDNATIQGLVLSQSLRIRTGAGDDTTFVHHIDVQRFEQFAGDGDDTLEFNNVYSRGSTTISGENNDDIVSITNMAAGTSATLLTGNGEDTVAIDNLGVTDNINLDTGGASDQVILTGLVYGYRANLLLGQGNDSLNVLPSTSDETALFLRELTIEGGDGNDSISMDASVSSPRETTITGGDGNDSIDQAGADLRDESLSSIENLQIDDLNTLLDSVYTALSDADIDTEPFGQTTIFDPIQPDITTTAAALVQNENGGAQALDDQLSLLGFDDTIYTGATISLGDTYVADQDVLELPILSTTDPVIVGTFDSTTGTLTLTGDGTADQYQTALRAVTFDNTSESPEEGLRTATITVTTDGGFDVTATRDISVLALNDTPVVTGPTDVISVNLDDNPTLPVPLNENVTITDADGIRLSGAVVVIDEGRQAGDILAFTDDPDDDITGTFNADTGVLTFTGVADIAAYQALLRTVTFDIGSTPVNSVREISFEVTDNSDATNATSAAATVEVDVISSQTNALRGAAEDLVVSTVGAPVAVDAGLEILATSSAALPIFGAEVAIISGLASTQDLLTFTPVDGIEGIYDGPQGVLTFTPQDNLADAQSLFQEILRSVSYSNIGTDTDTTDRVIEFTLVSNEDISTTRTLNLTQSIEDRVIQDFIANDTSDFPNPQKSETGLYFSIETEGTGDVATLDDQLRLDYQGTFLDGTEFDSQTDAVFPLRNLIAGWQEFFTEFGAGTSARLLIPSSLAYGPTGNGTIPGDTPLFFDVDLFEVIPPSTSS